jgi:hypothetical protein
MKMSTIIIYLSLLFSGLVYLESTSCKDDNEPGAVAKDPVAPAENDSRTLSWIHPGKPFAEYKSGGNMNEVFYKYFFALSK